MMETVFNNIIQQLPLKLSFADLPECMADFPGRLFHSPRGNGRELTLSLPPTMMANKAKDLMNNLIGEQKTLMRWK